MAVGARACGEASSRRSRSCYGGVAPASIIAQQAFAESYGVTRCRSHKKKTATRPRFIGIEGAIHDTVQRDIPRTVLAVLFIGL